MNPSTHIVNALSFDIEDWFPLVSIPQMEDPSQWDALPSVVEEHTRWIVHTISQAGVKATFFIVGWVAAKYPKIIRLIGDAGHEVAVHTYWHRRVNLLTPDQLREDLQRNIDIVQQHSGRPVLGFRAPSFSIVQGSEWVFDVLLDLGLKYDASLFPAPRGHGGYPCPRGIHQVTAPSGRTLHELPMSIMQLGPMRLPFSGGGYMRLLPKWAIRHGFAHCHRRNLPVVVYLHPKDFAVDCPRMPVGPIRQFKLRVGLKTTAAKLRMILDRYHFNTCASVLGLDPSASANNTHAFQRPDKVVA